jgi:hypothetical protein
LRFFKMTFRKRLKLGVSILYSYVSVKYIIFIIN